MSIEKTLDPVLPIFHGPVSLPAAPSAAPADARAPGAPTRVQSPEMQIVNGKIMVIVGFAIATFGILLYSFASFPAGIEGTGGSLLDMPSWLGLVVIGFGTLLWLVGNVIHFQGVLDGGPEEKGGR